MDLAPIIFSGTCLVALGVYWVKRWRAARDRTMALQRIADQQAAVRALAQQDEVGHRAGSYNPAQVFTESYAAEHQSIPRIHKATDVPHLRTLLERCGEAWGDWCEEPATDMVDFLTDACNARERLNEVVNVQALEIKDLANRLLNEQGRTHAQEIKAMKAMGWGADDSRWEPGTTAVDALIKERDDYQFQAASLRNVNESLAKLATTERDRILTRSMDEVRSERITHILALTFSWRATEANGDVWFYTHKPELISDKTSWRTMRGQSVPMLSGEATLLRDGSEPPWRESLLGYNQTTRTWEKPE